MSLTAIYLFEAPDIERAHQRWASYPSPMYRACRSHMAVLCESDTGPGATGAWLVRPL